MSKEQFKLLVCLSSPVTPLIAKWQVARNEPPAILHNCRSILQVENSLLREAMRLGSMIFDMTLVRSAKDEQARQADQEFVDALPKTFHSQGERAVAVSLHAGVKMEVDVRYDHRFKNQAYRRNRKAKHGLSPALLRLVRHRDCLVFEMNQSTRIGEDVITEELCHRIVKRMDYDNPIVAILNWPEIRPPTAETDSANTLR